MNISWRFSTVSIVILMVWVTVTFTQEQWTQRNPLPTDAHLHSVVWTGSQLVAVGWNGTILTSPDGITWTQQPAGTAAYL